MHFVFGGAFNGKRKWVKNLYEECDVTWISAYNHTDVPQSEGNSVMVVEGIEVWVRQFLEEGLSVEQAVALFDRKLTHWQKQCGQLVLIGTEVGKGIVPMDEEDRMWRDACGYVYQHIVKKAERVDQIWYGISTQLKGEQKG